MRLPDRRQEAVPVLGEVADDADQEVLLVAVVSVEGGPADVGALGDLLDRDRVEPPLQDQFDQGLAQR